MSRPALVLCLLAAVCSAEPPSVLRRLRPDLDGHIVGGEPVDITQFPWQVSLEQFKWGWYTHFCGGSIISSTWVLTAAHCLIGTSPQHVCVRAGSSFRESHGIVYNVTRIIRHEDYDRPTYDYDFALLRISKPITFGREVQIVLLGSSKIVSGTKVNITGWGRMSQGGAQPEQLHAVSTSIIDHDVCSAAYAHRNVITESMICAGEGGKDHCHGDSGGPLVVGNTQYGVVSWGFGCARPEFPGVNAYVPVVRSWITEKTGV